MNPASAVLAPLWMRLGVEIGPAVGVLGLLGCLACWWFLWATVRRE